MNQPSSKTEKSEIDEWQVYNDLLFTVKREVAIYRNKKVLDEDDVAILEKLTRIYCNLKDDYREDLKNDVWKRASVK